MKEHTAKSVLCSYKRKYLYNQKSQMETIICTAKQCGTLLQISSFILSKDTEYTHCRMYVSKRHELAVLGFFGIFSVYLLRANLSVAIVQMVKANEIEANMNITKVNNLTLEACPQQNDHVNGKITL